MINLPEDIESERALLATLCGAGMNRSHMASSMA